jgi:glutathione S-transferase
MITLFGFGPAFGLPDPSPFVMKTEVQLKMAGLSYKWQRGGPQAAPKGKIPFIDDNGLIVADSTFIRAHLETQYRVDLDSGLLTFERALAWSMERMLEDHLYFAMLHWMTRTSPRDRRISSTAHPKARAKQGANARGWRCTVMALAVTAMRKSPNSPDARLARSPIFSATSRI